MTTNGVTPGSVNSTVRNPGLATVDAGHFIAREQGPVWTVTWLAFSHSADRRGRARSTARWQSSAEIAEQSTDGPAVRRRTATIAARQPTTSSTATIARGPMALAVSETPPSATAASYARHEHTSYPGGRPARATRVALPGTSRRWRWHSHRGMRRPPGWEARRSDSLGDDTVYPVVDAPPTAGRAVSTRLPHGTPSIGSRYRSRP